MDDILPFRSRHPHVHINDAAVNGTIVPGCCPDCLQAAMSEVGVGWKEPFSARIPGDPEYPDIDRMIGPNGPTTRVITTGHGVRSVRTDGRPEPGFVEYGVPDRKSKHFCQGCRVNLKRKSHKPDCPTRVGKDAPDGKRYIICGYCERWTTPRWSKKEQRWIYHEETCTGQPARASTRLQGHKQTRRNARLRGAIEGTRSYLSPDGQYAPLGSHPYPRAM